jgi:Ca2+-binding EF-hand superfamily protein
MSSVSMGGGCSVSMYPSLQTSQARQSDKLQELFGKLDVNGDSAIDAEELQSFADHVGGKTGATVDAGALLTSLDSDGDGSITSTELGDNVQALFDQLRTQLMGTGFGAPPPPPDPAELFSSFDSNGDGSLSEDEFAAAIQGGPGARDKTGGAGFAPPDDLGRMLESLLADYGVAASSTATQGSSLYVAA